MQQQNKFREQAKTAALDRWYRKRLKAVAKQIAQIALEWEGTDPSQLQLSLFDYSVRLDEWARSVADIMLRRAPRQITTPGSGLAKRSAGKLAAS